jgi:hypothetical protein
MSELVSANRETFSKTMKESQGIVVAYDGLTPGKKKEKESGYAIKQVRE